MEWSQATPGSFLTQPVTRNIFLRRQFFVGWEAGHRLESSLREKLESAQKMLGAQHACSEFDKPTFLEFIQSTCPAKGNRVFGIGIPVQVWALSFAKGKPAPVKALVWTAPLPHPARPFVPKPAKEAGKKPKATAKAKVKTKARPSKNVPAQTPPPSSKRQRRS